MNFGAGNTGAVWGMGLTPLRQTKQKLAEETNTLGGNHSPVIHGYV